METSSDGADERLIDWLRNNPEVVRELRLCGKVDDRLEERVQK